MILAGTFLMVLPASAVVTQWTWPDGQYTIVKFNGTDSTTWTPPDGVTGIEYLVVAGGGCGGVRGSGGGAGGVVTNFGGTLLPVSGDEIITVGAGGAAISTYDVNSNDGADSSIVHTGVHNPVIANGGGGGGSYKSNIDYTAGHTGGSGGGAAVTYPAQTNLNSGETITPPTQGHNGGTTEWYSWPTISSGGGGGAGSAGGAGVNGAAGNGGAGISSAITGISVQYGGGGAGFGTASSGTASHGGGAIDTSGTSETGGGGGASSVLGITGAGGSGVVIIRYLTPGPAAPITSFTGSPLNGTFSLIVQFTDTSSNTPTSWSWNFGDGQTSTVQNPSHTYTSGVYTVSLTATNAGGSNTLEKASYVTVSSPATSIVSTGNRYIEQPGEEIVFNLTLDNAPLGLSGYNVNITIGNPALAEITAITFPSWAQAMNSNGPLPGSQNVLMKASDVNNEVQTGASDITLGTITIRGLAPGSTTISLSSANFDDEDGLDMPLTLTTGNLTVDYPLTDPLIIDITPTQAYNNGTVNIVINGTGYVQGMTVRLTKPGSDDVTSTNVYVESRVRAECLFDLDGKSDGIWNMTLTRTDGKTTTLVNGFTIVRPLVPVQGMTGLPTDVNGDGKYEDLNGNGQMDYADVNVFWNKYYDGWIEDNEPVVAFDLTGDGNLSWDDVNALFNMIS